MPVASDVLVVCAVLAAEEPDVPLIVHLLGAHRDRMEGLGGQIGAQHGKID